MFKPKFKWAEKTAVITGASLGIGTTAIALAEKGAIHLVDCCQEIVKVNEFFAANVHGHTVDVTIPEEMKQLATTLQGVDILICTGLHQGEIATSTLKDWHRLMNVNLWGVINSIKAFLTNSQATIPQLNEAK